MLPARAAGPLQQQRRCTNKDGCILAPRTRWRAPSGRHLSAGQGQGERTVAARVTARACTVAQPGSNTPLRAHTHARTHTCMHTHAHHAHAHTDAHTARTQMHTHTQKGGWLAQRRTRVTLPELTVVRPTIMRLSASCTMRSLCVSRAEVASSCACACHSTVAQWGQAVGSGHAGRSCGGSQVAGQPAKGRWQQGALQAAVPTQSQEPTQCQGEAAAGGSRGAPAKARRQCQHRASNGGCPADKGSSRKMGARLTRAAHARWVP